MNHSRDELEDCVYDYLASQPDKYHSIGKIFQDITTNDTGHRCKDLTDEADDRIYFMWVCNNLRFLYEGVRYHVSVKTGYIYLS